MAIYEIYQLSVLWIALFAYTNIPGRSTAIFAAVEWLRKARDSSQLCKFLMQVAGFRSKHPDQYQHSP